MLPKDEIAEILIRLTIPLRIAQSYSAKFAGALDFHLAFRRIRQLPYDRFWPKAAAGLVNC